MFTHVSRTCCEPIKPAAAKTCRSLRHRAGAAIKLESLEHRMLLAAILWDGGGDGDSWDDPANWSSDVIPGEHDSVSIGPDATVLVGAKGRRILVSSLDSAGSLTIRGGSLRTTSNLDISGSLTLESSSTLRARRELSLSANVNANGNSLQLFAQEVTVRDGAVLESLQTLRVRALAELWFGGEARGQKLLLDGRGTARTVLTGTLDASSSRRRDPAGRVEILGADIYVQDAMIDVCGPFGAGRVRIGGDLGGRGSLPHAQRVYFDRSSTILADARRLGDGGNVIIWSDEHTIFEGSISAAGGRRGGNGGFVETSAKGILNVGNGLASAAAPRGQGGQWLMDPYNVTIANGANDNAVEIPGTPGDPGNPTTFLLFGANAFIAVAGIVNALNSGTSVTVTTVGSGAQDGDIDVIAAINKTAGGEATLALHAANLISIGASISSASGRLNLLLQANSGPDDLDPLAGAVTIDGGSLSSNGGSITIAGAGVTLAVPVSINTGGGDLQITSFQSMNLGGAIGAGAGTAIFQAAVSISADTSITAGAVTMTTSMGSLQATQVIAGVGSAAFSAGANLTLGSGFGGLFQVATTLSAAAGTSGIGTLGFGSLTSVNADNINLRSGDGTDGAGASGSVNILTGNPVFSATAGGATSPLFFEIRQDASIPDTALPGSARFGGGLLPAALSYRSDDGALTIAAPAKVLGTNLTLGCEGLLNLGTEADTYRPQTISFSSAPSLINLAGDIAPTSGDFIIPSDVNLVSNPAFVSAPGNVTFGGTINGGLILNVFTTATATFSGAIGSVTPLNTLNVGGSGGLTRLFGDVRAGIVRLNDSVVVLNDVSITASALGPVFESTLDIGARTVHLRGPNPELNGGASSISGSGVLSIGPTDDALPFSIGGGAVFLSQTELDTLAPGFARIDLGSPTHDSAVTVNGLTLQNPTRILTNNGTISHQNIVVTGGGGLTLLVSGAGNIVYQGEIRTEGGPILLDGTVLISAPTAQYFTTDGDAAAGANTTFTGQVLPGDGFMPDLQFGAGETGIVTLQSGLGDSLAPFNSLLVFGGPNGAIHSSGDMWLGSNPASFFGTESPFEIGADLSVSVTSVAFLNGLRDDGLPRSLALSGSGDMQLHGIDIGGLDVTSTAGVVHFHGQVEIQGSLTVTGAARIEWFITISASSINFGGIVDVNGYDLSLVADFLSIGGNFFGGGGVSTLEIAPRDPAQIVSLNDTDSGLWLPASDLARLTDGFARIIFGSLAGTATLFIGNSSFSDPVEFRMAGPGGAIELNGPLTGTGNASFTFVGSGSTLTLNGNVTTDSEPIVFSDAVEIGAASVSIATIGGETPGAPITFLFRLDSVAGEANSLNLFAGVGDITLSGEVGGQPGGELGTLHIDSGGGVSIVSGGLIRSTGNQTHLRSIQLGADTAIQAGTAALFFIGAIACGPHDMLLRADDITIASPISGFGSLHISPFSIDRDVYINISPLGPGGGLTIDPAEEDKIEDGFEDITYGQEGQMSDMVIGGGEYSDPTTFVANGSDGTSAVTVAGDVTGTDNGGIRIRGGGSTTHLFGSIFTHGNFIEILDGVILHISGLMLDSTFGGDFPMGGQIMVDGPIDSEASEGNGLTLNSGFASLDLLGPIGGLPGGRLGSLLIQTLGLTTLAGGLIRTVGSQTYLGPVLIPVDLTLSTLNAPITFEDQVMGEQNLTIEDGSGETTFNDESTFESLTIETGSTRTFNAPVTIGTLTILGGTVFFNAPGLITDGTLVSGILSGDDHASFDGEFSWEGGSIEGNGLIIILPTGVFELSTGASRTLARGIQVQGRMHWLAGNLALDDATIEVLSGGVLEVSSSGTVTAAPMSTGALVNNGRIERSTPGAGAFVGIAIVNNSEIEVSAGSIKFTPLSGLFTNDGAITLGPAGSLIVRAEFAQSAIGSLTIRIAGTGVAEFGRLLVINGAALDGAITTDFVEGFLPEESDEFQFLSAETRSGTFSTQNLESPGVDRVSTVEYLANGAKLVIAPQFMVDFDGDGERTVADIFAFLSAWFAGNADFDHDGETTVADIFSYLSAWFAG